MHLDIIYQFYLIAFLDSLCTGMRLAVLNFYLTQELNCSHTFVGFLASVTVLSQRISRMFMIFGIQVLSCKGFLVLTIVILSYIDLVVIHSDSWNDFLLYFIIHGFMNNVKVLVKLLIATHHWSNIDYECNFIKYLRGLAMIAGPILGGFFYNDDCYECILKAQFILTTINLVLVLPIPKDDPQLNISFSNLVQMEANDFIRCIEYAKIKKNMVILLIKILTVISTTVYFTRFDYQFRNQFDVDIFTMVCVVAFQNSVMFMAHYLMHSIYQQINVKEHLEYCLFSALAACSVLIYILTSVHSLNVYLVTFIPFGILLVFMKNLWLLLNEDDGNCMESLCNIVEVITPICFGYFLDNHGCITYKLATIAPFIMASGVVTAAQRIN